jgi:hypothetical protein
MVGLDSPTCNLYPLEKMKMTWSDFFSPRAFVLAMVMLCCPLCFDDDPGCIHWDDILEPIWVQAQYGK